MADDGSTDRTAEVAERLGALVLRLLHRGPAAARNAAAARARGDVLVFLDGDMDRYRIHLELRLVDLDTFRLLNSGFRWIRPPDPYGG